MPIYEFFCKTCGKITEGIYPSGTKEIKCPCNQGEATKIISSSNFRIEGYSEANGYSDKGKAK